MGEEVLVYDGVDEDAVDGVVEVVEHVVVGPGRGGVNGEGEMVWCGEGALGEGHVMRGWRGAYHRVR